MSMWVVKGEVHHHQSSRSGEWKIRQATQTSKPSITLSLSLSLTLSRSLTGCLINYCASRRKISDMTATLRDTEAYFRLRPFFCNEQWKQNCKQKYTAKAVQLFCSQGTVPSTERERVVRGTHVHGRWHTHTHRKLQCNPISIHVHWSVNKLVHVTLSDNYHLHERVSALQVDSVSVFSLKKNDKNSCKNKQIS